MQNFVTTMFLTLGLSMFVACGDSDNTKTTTTEQVSPITKHANDDNFVKRVYNELAQKSKDKGKPFDLETETIRTLDNKKDELKRQDENSIAKGLKEQMDATNNLQVCSTIGTEIILAKLPQYSDEKLYEIYKQDAFSGRQNGTREQEIFLNHFWTISNQWAANACKIGASRASINEMITTIMPYVKRDLQQR